MREVLTLHYCETNRTKSASRGFKTVCPSCNGRDLWVTTDTSSCFCFECGVSYKVVKSLTDQAPAFKPLIGKAFDTKAIRATYKEATEYYHSCIGAEQEMFLRQRGISQEAISFFKIGFCPNSSAPMYLTETAKEAGLADGRGNPWLANRIVFPYIADGEVTDIRGRTIHDNDEPRYKSLYHRSEQRGAIYPFNFDAAMRKAADTGTLILTEGEIKAVVGDRFNFAVMALPGMLSYRPGLVAMPGVKLIVMFDNSSNHEDRLRVDKAIARFAQRVQHFSVVTLPLLGHDKMDIDTYLLTEPNAHDRFQHFIDNSIDYTQYKRLRSF